MDTGLMVRSNAAAFHERVLADRERTLAFREAIRQRVRPGHIVADIGCGTGILSMFAAEAGAAHVIAVEPRGDSAALAREIISSNDFDNIVEVVEADPGSIDPCMKVDVVICDLIGNFGPEEEIERVLGGFCARHLKPDGIAIPRNLSTYMAPVSFDDEGTGIWWEDCYGFNLSAGNRYLGRHGARYFAPARPWATLSPPVRIEHLRFGPTGVERSGDRTARFDLPDPALLEGFVGWFEADLAHGIRLSNRLHRADSSWPLWYWPVAPGVELAAGDRLAARILDMNEPARALDWQLDWHLLR